MRISTLAQTVDPKALELSFLRAPTMRVMPSNNSMATIGKAESWKSVKTATPRVEVEVWASLNVVASAEACVEALGEDSAAVEALAVVAEALVMVVAEEEEEVASVVAAVVLLVVLLAVLLAQAVLPTSKLPQSHQIRSPTMLLRALTETRSSMSEM